MVAALGEDEAARRGRSFPVMVNILVFDIIFLDKYRALVERHDLHVALVRDSGLQQGKGEAGNPSADARSPVGTDPISTEDEIDHRGDQ